MKHHLIMAAAVTVPWIGLIAVGDGRWPPVVLLLAVVLAVLPVVSTLLVRTELRREGVRGWASIVARLGLARPSRRDALRLGVPAFLAALLLPGCVVFLEPMLRTWLNVPAAWSTGWPTDVPDHLALAVVLLWLLSAVVVGPVVEEIVFRGLVQPRCAATASGRIGVGTVLFTAYHLWQPWTWMTVLVATVPVAWLRERSGSTMLAAGVHVAVNAVTAVLLMQTVLTR